MLACEAERPVTKQFKEVISFQPKKRFRLSCDDDAVGVSIIVAVLNPCYKALSFLTKNMRTESHDRVAFLVDEEKAKQ